MMFMKCLSRCLAHVRVRRQPPLGLGRAPVPLHVGGGGPADRAGPGKEALARPGVPAGVPAARARDTRGGSCRENGRGTVVARGLSSVGPTPHGPR